MAEAIRNRKTVVPARCALRFDAMHLCCAAALATASTAGVLGAPLTDTETQLLLASDGVSEDSFGTDVVREGDTLIIGAPQHFSNGLPGSFYLFGPDESGAWIEDERVFSPFDPEGAYGDEFGSALALDGDTLIVGAPLTPAGGEFLGQAYVYARGGETGRWSLQETLPSPSPRFGQSAALVGTTAVIASQYEAFVLCPDESGLWLQEAVLTADTVGTQVAFDGESIVVSGRFGNGEIGGVIYTSQDGAWTASATIAMPTTPFPDNPYMIVGQVSIDGDRLAMGITNALGPDQVFVYQRDEAGDWLQQAVLDPDGFEGDGFGVRVSLHGDLLLVGAPAAGLGGTVYVFERNEDGEWTASVELVPSDGFFGQYFGRALHVEGGVAVVGSGHHANGLHAGAAYVYDGFLPACPGDLDDDGTVGTSDFLSLLAAWGPNPGHPADLDGNGMVSTADFLSLLAAFGPCP